MNSGHGLDLFISISLTYPELNSVRYEAHHDLIVWEIALQGSIGQQEQERFQDCSQRCMETYHRIRGSQPVHSTVDIKIWNEITLLRFERDIATMSEDELELLLRLVKTLFPHRILGEIGESITEEPYKLQVKQNLLRRISQDRHKPHFLAFREQGKVLVYQK